MFNAPIVTRQREIHWQGFGPAFLVFEGGASSDKLLKSGVADRLHSSNPGLTGSLSGRLTDEKSRLSMARATGPAGLRVTEPLENLRISHLWPMRIQASPPIDLSGDALYTGALP